MSVHEEELAFVLMPVYRGQQLRTALLSLVMAGDSRLSAELSIYVMKSRSHTMSTDLEFCIRMKCLDAIH